MRVIVVVASKHGSTRGIAETIADELRERGVESDLYDVASAPGPGGYDGAIVGSAVYMGRWMAEAREYVERNHGQLRTLPVWLFSSGPLGDELLPAGDTPDAANVTELCGAVSHHTFPGRLDVDSLGVGERLVARVVRAPDGDYRDFRDIRAWAGGIAAHLDALSPVAPIRR